MTSTPRAGIPTAVFPVAGLGTRFLPATRAVPKELLPVVDRPLVQYAVHEAVEAGAKTLVFVISHGKESVAEHFRPDPTLEASLQAAGKQALVERLHDILPAGVNVEVAYQPEPLGLGHAVLCAREHVDENAFFSVLLPDDMVLNDGPGALQQMADVHARTGGGVVGVERVDPAMTGSYGIAEVDGGEPPRITSLVEKPAPEDAPSNLGVIGRYILDGRIFSRLQDLGAGAGGEIQLTDAIAGMLGEHPVYAGTLNGTRYDCGNRAGMLKANIDYALANPDLREGLLAHLRGLDLNG
ncbi:UTP--glucose-1-phosphate uridylyltransferase [Marinihelvus fidelis]|uniref:UTP--glucose-1-phosphate uridylyltransferase n=1 Tax=Marinihelvus fidelis TaxID=2613842 RepID=A0A5N0TAF7_9GAMM|nr:UTP--glucose-1-phosphate uridylyltransferase [Marinihelvus fidelis]KAA9132053.1 UTP--glucose-1-phosphate uridylyltransferase [Marinihelvus fidelis]